jgi:rfaE bifunctional protein nucleotidyltransferase chain/domain
MKHVWVNGCFDILHHGHLQLLKYASTLGDKVCVGIDSDVRVKSLKGEDRPVNNQTFRKELLEALVYVDKVYIFDTDYQLSEYIRQLSPHMVIGDDYIGKKIIGADFCEKITFFPRISGFSTTETIKKVKNG